MDNDFSAPTPPPMSTPPPLVPPRKQKAGRGWRIATFLFAGLLVLLLVSWLAEGLFHSFLNIGGIGSDSRLQEITIENNHSLNKIAVIPVEGIISGSGLDASGYGLVELIEDQLKLAGKDDRVKAVLLKINSPGGEVLASDDIYNAILRFQNEHNKPVIASMGSLAASGGYYVAAPCRWIVANELTITGSIGVIMHTYNYRGLMNKVGLRPMVYKSGRFKDMLSGEKDLEKLGPAETADVKEEEAMVTKMITETYEKFKSVVAEGRRFSSNRNQLNKDLSPGRPLSPNWAGLADGRILSGKEAYEHGFVDELGNWRTALKRAHKISGIENADLIAYQMPFSLGNLFSLFGKSETKKIQIDFGFDLPRLSAGLYYLSPTFLR
jgi:protease IV